MCTVSFSTWYANCGIMAKALGPLALQQLMCIPHCSSPERVYPSDIKKLIGWYNILVEAGITDFTPVEVKEAPAEGETEGEKGE